MAIALYLVYHYPRQMFAVVAFGLKWFMAMDSKQQSRKRSPFKKDQVGGDDDVGGLDL